MNGARTTFMRRGYLLTALAAAVLLAASPGNASAQSIGFVGSSGMVSETASMEPGAIEGPHKITIRASGFPPVGSPARSITGVMVATNANVGLAIRSASGAPIAGLAATEIVPGTDLDLGTALNTRDEIVLMVAQNNAGAGTTQAGQVDDNWLDEKIKLTLSAANTISVNPNVYTLTVDDSHVAPIAKFTAPSFTLTEGSERMVGLDIVEGMRGAGIPDDAADAGETGTVTVRVSNHQMVTIGPAGSACPTRTAPVIGQTTAKAFHIALTDGDWPTPNAAAAQAFGRTAQLATTRTIANLAGTTADETTADMLIRACNVSGFRDQSITLTIVGTPSNTGLVESPAKPAADKRGDIMIDSPLTVTVDSDEAAPTLSFSPTDVTIDEGGETSTRLIADGMSATEVGMVKLMVEGDAMVDLYHEDTMLEEMDGYVMVDMGMSNSVKLTAMSMSDPDLMDGDMAYKAWKLMEGSSDAMIGDDYWFRVDVRGSTAVPALPLVGQLLLALFLMAGGSRLYRRRNG